MVDLVVETKKNANFFTWFLRTLYLLSFIVLFVFLIKGWAFYSSRFSLRLHLPEYRLWRSAGELGHGFGMAGGFMLLAMLLYSLRKRLVLFSQWGHVSHWLKIHIYFGIIGPCLIILHSAFKVQGLVAVSFWSMVAVALSGVLGRYLYFQLPRNILGDELNLQQATDVDANFYALLSKRFALSPELLKFIDQKTMPSFPVKANSIRVLVGLWMHDLSRPLLMKKMHGFLAQRLKMETGPLHELFQLIDDHILLRRRILLWNYTHSLFHYWHIIHRPFAYIMYVIMTVHISISLWLGYSWIF